MQKVDRIGEEQQQSQQHQEQPFAQQQQQPQRIYKVTDDARSKHTKKVYGIVFNSIQ
jgi:hypothetical protein